MTNAFTAKPDVSKFVKEAKHSLNSSAIGTKAAANPSPEQRYFFSDNRPHEVGQRKRRKSGGV